MLRERGLEMGAGSREQSIMGKPGWAEDVGLSHSFNRSWLFGDCGPHTSKSKSTGLGGTVGGDN